jgi:GcrA cell cycle regulator
MTRATPIELVNLIAEMRHEGKTYSEIGEVTGRGFEAIHKVITAYGLAKVAPPVFWNDSKVDDLKRLNATGISAAAMGRELGCGRNAVIGKLHRLHVAFVHKPCVSDRPKRKTHQRPPKRHLDPSIPKREQPGMADLPVVETMAPPSIWVVFTDRDMETQCAWPVHGAGYQMVCCGAARWHDETSYCQHHHKRGTVANRPR